MHKITKSKTDIFVLCGTILLFAFFFFYTGVDECGDSYQYLHQHPMREPVYSLLLQFLQAVFSTHFDVVLSLIQNSLAVVCIYWSYQRLSVLFKMNNFQKICSFVLLIFPHILTPLFSNVKLVMTTTIMTEGITFSMYYVWFVMLIGILTNYYQNKNSAIILSFLLSLLLVLTRGQMLVCLIVWMIVVVAKAVIDKKHTKSLIFILAFVCAFFAKGQLTKWYNLAESGYYVDTVSSKPMLLANILYVCDEGDEQYIAEEDLKTAFSNMLSNARQDSLNVANANGSIIDKALYHEMCHEPLNFDYIDPEIRKVINSRNGTDENEFFSLMIQEDDLCAQISSQLLPKIAGKYLKNYFILISLGFIRSVAIEKSFLPFVAILLYLIAIGLTIFLFKKKGINNCSLSMLLVLLCICGTVCGTALVIECLHRYMIYNFPFFYIIGLLLLTDTVRNVKLSKKQSR